MRSLCIIPARSGSKGVPGKNIKPLAGRPLITYTYDAAQAAHLLDKVILSTDGSEIANTAQRSCVEVPFLRPANLAQDDTPTIDVILHAITFFEGLGERFDTIVLLQPTSPFRPPGFIDECIQHFVASGADSLVSVRKVPHEYNPHWTFLPANDGFIQIATGEKEIITSRQKLPPAYIRDGSVYVFKANNFTNGNNMYGDKIAMLKNPIPYHVNIDTPEDWIKAERVALQWQALLFA